MRRMAVLNLGLLLVVGLAGCAGGNPETDSQVPENAALKITGQVDREFSWTEEEIRSMDTMDAESTNREGKTATYTGVLITDLLATTGPQGEATTLVFVADDGSTGEAALVEVQACADCIVSFRNKGGFSIVMPGFPDDMQVNGVIEIQVK